MTTAFTYADLVAPKPAVHVDSKSTDLALLTAAASGHRTAIGLLYARHAATLRVTAACTLGRHAQSDAEDVVNDVFVTLLEGRGGTFDPLRGSPLAWLRGFVRRAASAHGRATPEKLTKHGNVRVRRVPET
jgi:DNA-directed RNA polymerase specialized sigma24 family protein